MQIKIRGVGSFGGHTGRIETINYGIKASGKHKQKEAHRFERQHVVHESPYFSSQRVISKRTDYAWTETIYTRADGSVEPLAAPISTVDNVTYTLTSNIAARAWSALGKTFKCSVNSIVYGESVDSGST